MNARQEFNDLIRAEPYFGQLINWCFPEGSNQLVGKIIAVIGCSSGLMSTFFALDGVSLCQFIQASAEALPVPEADIAGFSLNRIALSKIE